MARQTAAGGSVLADWVRRTLGVVPTETTKPAGPVVGRYDFGAGLPAPESFPLDRLAELSARVLAQDGPGILEYYDIEDGESQLLYGHRGLRESIARLLETQGGRRVEADDIMLTLGSAQALGIVAEALIEPGDAVLVEDPTFFRAVQYFRRSGGRVVPLMLDDHGLDPCHVERELKALQAQGAPVKALYTISRFHSPLGVSLSLDRRHRLLELAAHWGFAIIEDDVYGMLRYEGEPMPSLFALDENHQVVTVNSFSKTIAPGLRMGWIAGGPGVSEALALSRRDIGVSQYLARLLQAFIDEGHFAPHLAGLNELYRVKRDIAHAALQEHVGDLARWRLPKGSMFLWLEFDSRVDVEAALLRAAEQGVIARPGTMFALDPATMRQNVRIAFGRVPREDLGTGIERFGAAVARSVGP